MVLEDAGIVAVRPLALAALAFRDEHPARVRLLPERDVGANVADVLGLLEPDGRTQNLVSQTLLAVLVLRAVEGRVRHAVDAAPLAWKERGRRRLGGSGHAGGDARPELEALEAQPLGRALEGDPAVTAQ